MSSWKVVTAAGLVVEEQVIQELVKDWYEPVYNIFNLCFV